jgi:hypothetical protein
MATAVAVADAALAGSRAPWARRARWVRNRRWCRLSDGLVAASLFGPKRRTVDAAVMLTYAAAQALLAAALEDR